MTDDPDLARLQLRSASRPADVIGRVFDPIGVVLFTLGATCWQSAQTLLSAAGWFLTAAAFMALVPAGILHLLLHLGRVGERQVPRRSERYLPYAATMASVAVGVVVLYALDAPTKLLQVVGAMLIGIVSMAALNMATKVSLHSGVLAGAVVVLAFLFGPGAGLVGAAMWCLVAWARVRAGRHSISQVLLGGLTGSAAPLVALWAVR